MAELRLPKFSIGAGDRFAHQAKAQLRACMLAADAGAEVVPVWNKSNREHLIIGSEPSATRSAADAAVKELGWGKPYFVDADHINLTSYERFVAPCDFFTVDVADNIGKRFDEEQIAAFLHRHPELIGEILIPRIEEPFHIDLAFAEKTAKQFLAAGAAMRERSTGRLPSARVKASSSPRFRWMRPIRRRRRRSC